MTLNDISCCPTEIIKDLITHSNLRKGSKILEIGSDNGTITNLLTNKGFIITCNESNKELIDIAKSNISDLNISYVEGNFEEQIFGKRKYDLVLANESFESIPQPIGYIKCHEVLKDEGHLAIIWNISLINNSEINKELPKIFNKYSEIVDYVDYKECKERIDKLSNDLYKTGIFTKPRIYQKAWSKEYTIEEYLDLINTNIKFDEVVKTKTYNDIKDLNLINNGRIKQDYLTVLFISKRRLLYIN